MIDRHWTINETVGRIPASLSILNRMGVDTCCGGSDTIAVAALKAGVDEAALISTLTAVEQLTQVQEPVAHECGCGCRRSA